MNFKFLIILTIISFLFICSTSSFANATPVLTISDVSDSPDPFSPNGDGIDDTVEFKANISIFGFDKYIKYNKKRRLFLIWSLCITDSEGKRVRKFFHMQKVDNNTDIEISQIWNGKRFRRQVVEDGKYFYRFDARIKRVKAKPKGSDVTVKTESQLSVSVLPDSWDIGEVGCNSIITMKEVEKITVLNDGEINEIYSLRLVNSTGWQCSQSNVGPDTYILNAAFSEQLENIFWEEENHAFSTELVLCSDTKFVGDQSGVDVSPGEERTLWLQFKAPTTTSISTEQDIEVIINAQVP